ncbi:hypothetical protein J6590_087786 [Homalodisca vitripennis]|nr:hypothetical protein J6590_087786 [Homalodisca vitripennis]
MAQYRYTRPTASNGVVTVNDIEFDKNMSFMEVRYSAQATGKKPLGVFICGWFVLDCRNFTRKTYTTIDSLRSEQVNGGPNV